MALLSLAVPRLQLVSTLLAVLVLFLAGSGAPTPVLGASDDKVQAADGAALPTSSRGLELFRQHEGMKPRAQLSNRRLLQSIQCPDGQVQCPSGIKECFYSSGQNCNGYNDCSDGSEEDDYYCANVSTSCVFPRLKCPSHKCSTQSVINGKSGANIFWCDRTTDCFDNSDEDPAFCASYDCASQGAARCPGSIPQCMPRVSTRVAYFSGRPYPGTNGRGQTFGPIPDDVPTAMCDGVKDCEDGSDEDFERCFGPGPTRPPPIGQGVCGSGPAYFFPVRCWFNNDPMGRYVCCDDAGCDGFSAYENLVPRCKVNGYAPKNFGLPDETTTFPKETTTFPKDTPCPLVGGFASNSCFSSDGSYHVCCANPDSCAAPGANGEPRCTNDNYVFYNP
ncbi:hypothetical protein KFL_000010510 [Klebsormidium nitens]|uniref:Uncharacterized protein n=1 Tax=Klebsormidium nitens TaxID=105231 RepID=A0A0U9HHV0_KLENI|nr:hypothetical protein KFL_000010510 [Klebsormidium nitens]|eukprot:GAQ77602.1 hypothetical protein KFL_000010510 [Klebsormidium nitens]